MPAKQFDITIEQGATFVLNAIWRDAAGEPVNLTGYTAKMQARWSYSDATALVTFTTADNTIVLGGSAGTIAVSGLATLTGVTKPRTGVYDLELTETAALAGTGEGLDMITRLLDPWRQVPRFQYHQFGHRWLHPHPEVRRVVKKSVYLLLKTRRRHTDLL